MAKHTYPRGPEWERGYMAGYYAKRKDQLEYLRECRAENERLREELEDWKAHFEAKWESVGKHPASYYHKYIQEIELALNGG